jgi:hypothetical protein
MEQNQTERAVVAGVDGSECGLQAVVRGSEPGRTGPRPEPVIGVDGSPTSEAATAFAFEAAPLRHVPLVAVHV